MLAAEVGASSGDGDGVFVSPLVPFKLLISSNIRLVKHISSLLLQHLQYIPKLVRMHIDMRDDQQESIAAGHIAVPEVLLMCCYFIVFQGLDAFADRF